MGSGGNERSEREEKEECRIAPTALFGFGREEKQERQQCGGDRHEETVNKFKREIDKAREPSHEDILAHVIQRFWAERPGFRDDFFARDMQEPVKPYPTE